MNQEKRTGLQSTTHGEEQQKELAGGGETWCAWCREGRGVILKP